MTRPLRSLAAALGTVVLAAACGTQVSHDRIVAGAGGGPVALAPGQAQTAGPAPADTTGGPVAPAPGQAQTAGPAPVGTGGGPVGLAPGKAQTAATTGTGTGTGLTTTSGRPVTGGQQPAGASTAAGGDHTPVALGSVGNYSGLAGGSLGSAPAALQAWAKWTNARGGVAGHPVNLFVNDDQGSNSQAASIVQDFVENKKVSAIVGSYVPLTVSGFKDYVTQKQVPVVGGDALTADWAKQAYFFNQGADATAYTYGFVKLAHDQGRTKMSVFYCVETTACTSIKDQVVRWAPAAGSKVVDQQQIALGQANFTTNCIQARNAGADAITVAADGPSISRVADNCATQGYHPMITIGGLAITNDQATDPNLEGMTVSVSNFPWMLSATPAQEAFQQAMRQYAPNALLSGTAASAWASAELFKKAVENTGPAATQGPITRQLVLEGLWKIKNETLGGLAPPSLNFNQGKPVTSNRCYFAAQIKGGKWTAPYGNQTFCAPPEQSGEQSGLGATSKATRAQSSRSRLGRDWRPQRTQRLCDGGSRLNSLSPANRSALACTT